MNMLKCLYIQNIFFPYVYFFLASFLSSFIPFLLCLNFFPQGFLVLIHFFSEKDGLKFCREQNFSILKTSVLENLSPSVDRTRIRKRGSLFCHCLEGNQLHLLGNQIHLFFLEYIYCSYFLSFSRSSLCSSHLFLCSTIFFVLVLSPILSFQSFIQTHFTSHGNSPSCSTQYFHIPFFSAHFHSSFVFSSLSLSFQTYALT